jgi:MFS family permease
VNWVLALAILPETRKVGVVVDGAHAPRRSLFPFEAMREAARIDGVWALLIMGFVFTFGFSLMESGLALFVERQFVDVALHGTEEGLKTATRLATAVFFTVGVTAVFVQGGLIRPLQKAFGEKKLLLAGSLLIMVGFVAVAALPWLPVAFVAMFPITAVIAVGSGLFTPSSSALLSRSVDEHRQGSVLGVGQATSALGRIFGPGLSGLLLDQHRSLPFAAGALLLGIAALLTTRVRTPGGGASRSSSP